jgi:ribose 5-phosphate isomerase B
MRIALGADHRGVALKASIRSALDEAARGESSAPPHTYVDFGAHSEASADYPDFARPVAEGVASGAFERGVLVCGTGVGMAIAANKIPGVRAALVHDPEGARLAREHNDANVLTLAGGALAPAAALSIVHAFLDTPFAGGRHQRRVAKIAEMENCLEGAT